MPKAPHLVLCAALLLSGGALSTLSACASTSGVRQAPAPTQAAKAAWEKLRTLEGEWEGQHPETGAWMPSSSMKVSSANSVLRELMFPGAAHEMTNMYHLDGDRVVLTHYCGMGNQPRLTARGLTPTPEGDTLHFTIDSVSNLADAQGMFMGDLRLTFRPDGTLVQSWRSIDKGAISDKHTVEIVLRRRQG
jgi:hypothetical protein